MNRKLTIRSKSIPPVKYCLNNGLLDEYLCLDCPLINSKKCRRACDKMKAK